MPLKNKTPHFPCPLVFLNRIRDAIQVGFRTQVAKIPTYPVVYRFRLVTSGVTIGRARRAVHAGPALWGAQNLPDAVLKKFFLGKRGPFWNTCTRAHCNLVTPLLVTLCDHNSTMSQTDRRTDRCHAFNISHSCFLRMKRIYPRGKIRVF